MRQPILLVCPKRSNRSNLSLLSSAVLSKMAKCRECSGSSRIDKHVYTKYSGDGKEGTDAI
jgi:hypothetical protein